MSKFSHCAQSILNMVQILFSWCEHHSEKVAAKVWSEKFRLDSPITFRFSWQDQTTVDQDWNFWLFIFFSSLFFLFFFPRRIFVSEVTSLFFGAFEFTPFALLYRLKNAQDLILWPFSLINPFDRRARMTRFVSFETPFHFWAFGALFKPLQFPKNNLRWVWSRWTLLRSSISKVPGPFVKMFAKFLGPALPCRLFHQDRFLLWTCDKMRIHIPVWKLVIWNNK